MQIGVVNFAPSLEPIIERRESLNGWLKYNGPPVSRERGREQGTHRIPSEEMNGKDRQ